jgi:hypothetical protein
VLNLPKSQSTLVLSEAAKEASKLHYEISGEVEFGKKDYRLFAVVYLQFHATKGSDFYHYVSHMLLNDCVFHYDGDVQEQLILLGAYSQDCFPYYFKSRSAGRKWTGAALKELSPQLCHHWAQVVFYVQKDVLSTIT